MTGWEANYVLPKGRHHLCPGVYIGLLDQIPFGAAMNKGLTFKMGQTHVPRYTAPLLETIESGAIDPIIRHHPPATAGRCTRSLQDVSGQ